MKITRQDVLVLIVCTIGLCAASLSSLSYFQLDSVGVDDSNIFFTFAKNLLAGHGLVWNPSEGPVEGYTSTLWLLICTLAQTQGDGFEITLLALNVALLATALAFFANTFSKALIASNILGSQNWILVLLTIAVCILNPAFLSWAIVSLMDTGLWSAILLFGLCSAQSFAFSEGKKGIWNFSLALVLMILTRPEGTPVALGLLAYCFILVLLQGKALGSSCKLLLPALIGSLASFSALVGFRIWYFGYPFPNTYYAKVGSSVSENVAAGSLYFQSWLTALPFVALCVLTSLVVVVVALVRALAKTRTTSVSDPLFWWTSINASVFLLGCALYIYLGGDHFPLHRQFQPFWPIACMALFGASALAIRSLGQRTGRLLLSGLAVLALSTTLFATSKLSTSKDMAFEYTLTKFGRTAGHRLNTVFASSSYPPIAGIAVGGLGFAYKGDVIDLMGIVNTRMAHASTERSGLKNHAAFHIPTFYEIAPQLILHFGPTCRLRAGFENDKFILESLQQIPKSERFRKQYVKVRLGGSNPAVCGFAAREFAENNTLHGIRFYNW